MQGVLIGGDYWRVFAGGSPRLLPLHRSSFIVLPTPPILGVAIPERGFAVKGPLAGFFAHLAREGRWAASGGFGCVACCFPSVALASFVRVWVVTVGSSRLTAADLFTAAAPQSIPSWIRLLSKQSLRSRGPDTEDSLATVSRARGRLNQINARQLGRVHWPPQTDLVPRGPLPHRDEEGPMQPLPCTSPWSSPDGPSRPSLLSGPS